MALSKKQMGDTGERLIAAKLKAAGFSIELMPTNWKNYDLTAKATPRGLAKRICVKCRHLGKGYIAFRPDESDWLAVVLIGRRPYRYFVIPHKAALKVANQPPWPSFRRLWVRDIPTLFRKFENNFDLRKSPG